MKHLRIFSGIFLLSCMIIMSCKEDPLPTNPSDLSIDQFTIIPISPTTKDMVRMITCDCKYNVLASVKIRGNEIEVRKRFNSQLKWPCLLRNDTIPLGQLSQGNYWVTFLIVDSNPVIKDSISVREIVVLRVKK